MASRTSLTLPSWPLIFLLLLLTDLSPVTFAASERKAYIVYMGALPRDISTADAEAAHKDILDRVSGSDSSSTNLLYSYKRSFNGFSAMLSEEEAEVIRDMDGVVSVFPSKNRQLHTTRSWDFMNFHLGASRNPSIESDVIVGVIDTGIWPGSESFDDTGYGPPPNKWKGTCRTSKYFKCNNKIIGAQFYHSGRNMTTPDIPSPVDTDGHGTHTASTVAGRQVTAGLYGYAQGIARGGVPSARIAVYKVCWSDNCDDADILAAFDDAIADGVDILSLSLGGITVDYIYDALAIGSFHAMRRGILTSISAGNSGLSLGSVTNIAPWMLTVAASTIDRKLVADAKLGDGKIYEGVAINIYDLEDRMYPIIYGGDAANKSAVEGYIAMASNCFMGALDKNLVTGKIVFCDSPILGLEVTSAGGVGTIMQYNFSLTSSYTAPATLVSMEDGRDIKTYMNKTRNPTAALSKTRQVGDPEAPVVADFSSRGPNTIAEILKPDLTAPGVNILAAWSSYSSMTGAAEDTRKVPYNIISGTSMSCPHVTGAAAYVKTFHPAWSPAAIKSALMTTAWPMRPSKNPDKEFSYGAGHLNPHRALQPGLIYDAGEEDYVRFLCGAGYSTEMLRQVTGDKSVCTASNNGTAWDLNYPSFALVITEDVITRSFHRTVTNVGLPRSTYIATVNAPHELRVHVNPNVLSFERVQEKQSFVVHITAELKDIRMTQFNMSSASLTWSDGLHEVRSPIVVYMPPPPPPIDEY